MILYRAVATRERQSWTVRIERPDGSVAGGTVASALDQVEAKAREVLGHDNDAARDAEISVEARIPAATEHRILLAEELARDIEAEVQDAQQELLDLDWPASDIEWFFHSRHLTPRPTAIAVTNDAVARTGLAAHPDVLGLRWQDHGHFETITCSPCVEEHRSRYVAAPPSELNELIRTAGPGLFCDDCKEDLIERAAAVRIPAALAEFWLLGWRRPVPQDKGAA